VSFDIVITVGARGATHTPSMNSIEIIFKIPKINIKHMVEEINVIAIQYASSIILHKKENRKRRATTNRHKTIIITPNSYKIANGINLLL